MSAKGKDLYLQIQGISKEYPIPRLNPFKPSKRLKALKKVDLDIPKESVTCILGPNGAGKTTLIKILAGLILPNSGNLLWGESIELRNNKIPSVGLVTPNDRSFYWRLTGRQNLDFFASLYNIKNSSARVQQVLDEVGLKQNADRPYRQYSAGMKQKLNIARALLSNPSLYLLDEPATHLDPIAKEEFWDFVNRVLLKKEGATVILCTHDLEEAATLAHHIALLNDGGILAQGDPEFLKQMVQQESYYSLSYINLPTKWEKQNQSIIHSQKEGEIVVRIEERDLSSMLEGFLSLGGEIKEVRKKEPLLMDVMRHFIGAHNE